MYKFQFNYAGRSLMPPNDLMMFFSFITWRKSVDRRGLLSFNFNCLFFCLRISFLRIRHWCASVLIRRSNCFAWKFRIIFRSIINFYADVRSRKFLAIWYHVASSRFFKCWKCSKIAQILSKWHMRHEIEVSIWRTWRIDMNLKCSMMVTFNLKLVMGCAEGAVLCTF